MKGFVRGILVGVGIGMLVAPMRGEDMRRMLSERINEFRGYLPENANEYVRQVSDRVSQTGSKLGDIAQKATTEVKQTGQDVADTTKQTAKSAKSSAQSGTSSTTSY